MWVTFLVLAIPLLVLLLLGSLHFLRRHERAVVFRLGRFRRVIGPGIHGHFPFVDRIVRLDLNEKLPGWQALPERELQKRIQEEILANPDF